MKHLLILFSLFFSLVLLVGIPVVSADSWWNNSFSNRIPITVTTNGNSTPVDYQVKFSISYESEMQIDFDDIRFVNSSNGELAHWIESKVNSSYASVWVSLSDAITNPGNDTIWMYYGNGNVSDGGNIGDTFIVGDDGETGSPSGDWTQDGTATITIESTVIKSGAHSLKVNTGANNQFAMYLSIPNSVNNILEYSFRVPVTTAATGGRLHDGVFSSETGTAFFYKDGGNSFQYYDTAYHTVQAASINTWYDIKLVAKSLGKYDIYIDDVLKTTDANTRNSPGSYNRATVGGYHSNGDTYIDNFRVRKYIANEPTPSYGTTQHHTNSFHYNSTSPYNITITSSGTLTSNRSIISSDDTNWTAYSTGTTYWQHTSAVTPAGQSTFTISGDALDNFTATNLTVSMKYDLTNSTGIIEQQTIDVNGVVTFSTNLTAGDYWIEISGVPIFSNKTPVSPHASDTVTGVTFSADVDQSDANSSWLFDSVIVEWDNNTGSPSYTNSSPVVGTYNITLISYNLTDDTKNSQTIWEWTVTDELKNIPGIVNGVYGFSTGNVPSNATILSLKNESVITVEFEVNWDTIDSTNWTSVKDGINYAFLQNTRTALKLNFSGDYTSETYRTQVKNNFSTYLSDLTIDPYQADVQFITLDFDNVTSSDVDKVSFINGIISNLTLNVDYKFKIIVTEDLTGLSVYVSQSPIKYIILSNKSNWVDDEVRILRGNTTKSRMYSTNTSFLESVLFYRNSALNKMRGSVNTSDQYTETDTVKLDNGDVIFYNNASIITNVIIAGPSTGHYFDTVNDTYFDRSGAGILHFNVPAENFTYVIKDTFEKIEIINNSSSQLWGSSITDDNTFGYYNDSALGDSFVWAGSNTDLKFEFWDPNYKKTNVHMIHYEWINASLISNYSEYKYIIIADKNGDEINDTINRPGFVYGYISVQDYADSTAWENGKKAEIDVWIDTYNINVFLDGIDFSISAPGFDVRFKNLTDYIRDTKDKEAMLNTYTAYNEFATYGDAVMKESCFARWGGNVNDPTYTWEDMSLERERANFFTSHNITVLGMSFGDVDDYAKMAYTSNAFAVLYGFDGRNSWKYGQPNFQAQKDVYIYDYGDMLESTFTETTATDWNRLYSNGRVHINPVDYTYWIDNNLVVNSFNFTARLYSGAVGSGDRNVYVYLNDSSNMYTLAYDSVTSSWQNKTIQINASDYSDTGHYFFYGYTRPDAGGYNYIRNDIINGSGIHTWYDTGAENLPDTFVNQTWNAYARDKNFLTWIDINVTTSEYLDHLSNRITQSSVSADDNKTTVISSDNSYPFNIWTAITHVEGKVNVDTYFKASNDTWVIGSTNDVSDASANVLNWSYTTIDGEQYGSVREYINPNNYTYRYLFPSLSTQEVYTGEVLEYYPPTPTNLVNMTGNFWVNNTWSAGLGNTSDSYNVSVNSIWHNNTVVLYYNDSYVAHGWQNITVYAYNNSGEGTLSISNVSQDTQIPNNLITITNTSDWTGITVHNVFVDYDATDADSDTPTFSCNNTTLFTDFSTVTGRGNWTSTVGVYYVDFGVSDGYGSTDNYTMTITVESNPIISNVLNGSVSDTVHIVNWTLDHDAHNRVIYNTGVVSAGSTSCEGEWDANYLCANATDGNWSSYARPNGSSTSYVYFNYTMSTDANQTESLWHVKGDTETNLTIPLACWNDTLRLRVMVNGSSYDTSWQGYNGSGWVTINTNWGISVCEQEMLFKYTSVWDNSTSLPDITLVNLTPLTNYNFQVQSFNVTDISYSSISSIYNFTTAAPPPGDIPPDPINLADTKGNFWINYTWSSGVGNITDSYNITTDGIYLWTNGSSAEFYFETVVPHGSMEIIIYAYNDTNNGTLSTGFVTDTVTLLNNPVTLTGIADFDVYENDTIIISYSSTDADGDTPTYTCNRTDLFADFDTSSGIGTWKPLFNQAGIYYVDMGVHDGYGSTDNYTMTIVVHDEVIGFLSLWNSNSGYSLNVATYLNTNVEFVVVMNHTANNISWYNNSSFVGNVSDTTRSTYTTSWGTEGTYYVNVSATDDYNSTGNSTFTINITSSPTVKRLDNVFENIYSGYSMASLAPMLMGVTIVLMTFGAFGFLVYSNKSDTTIIPQIDTETMITLVVSIVVIAVILLVCTAVLPLIENL